MGQPFRLVGFRLIFSHVQPFEFMKATLVTIVFLANGVNGVSADACINYMNSLRSQHGGHAALTHIGIHTKCLAQQAADDAAEGAHHDFGKCSESAQCEAGNSDSDGCHKSIDQFYAEGPGGGHYDIMMSDSYHAVEWGTCSNCMHYKGFTLNYFTFDFYTSAAINNATGASNGKTLIDVGGAFMNV